MGKSQAANSLNTFPLANAGVVFYFWSISIQDNLPKACFQCFSLCRAAQYHCGYFFLSPNCFTGSCKRGVHTQSAIFLPNSKQMFINNLKIHIEAKYTKFTKTAHCCNRHVAQVSFQGYFQLDKASTSSGNSWHNLMVKKNNHLS